jgi:uncharacterized protein (DUF433 family)
METTYNTNMDSAIARNPKIMHGAPCFAGTRVAVRTLFDHLEAGYSIDEFLAQFPTVQRMQVVEIFESLRNEIEQTVPVASQ